jgi:NTE family protein
VVTVSLRDVEDAARAGALLHIPTALTIAPTDVQRLQAAGREALRRSPAFQQLVRSLDSGLRR